MDVINDAFRNRKGHIWLENLPTVPQEVDKNITRNIFFTRFLLLELIQEIFQRIH